MSMEESSVAVRLRDILNEIDGLRNETTGLKYETFADAWVLRRACERAVEIISEASRHIPTEMKDTEPGIPWRQIAGIGNVLRHDYENISSRVIWDIIINHLDTLESAARRLLAAVEVEPRQR